MSSNKLDDIAIKENIYKVNIIKDGNITSIYVFNGDKSPTNKETVIKQLFTDKENEQIEKKNIDIFFSDQIIRPDDTIGIIKLKILSELKDLSMEELYLYCKKRETFNNESLYKTLTINNKIQLTKIRLDQFISNIVSDDAGNPIKMPEDKDVYDYDDIFNMNLENTTYVVNEMLGRSPFITNDEYLFVHDPYDVTDYDKLIEKSERKSTKSVNSNLLFNSGTIIDNNIYLCTATDVLDNLVKKKVSEETTIKIYFPVLYSKNINGLKGLSENKDALIEQTQQKLNETIFTAFKTIDMFYDVYKLRTGELNYINKGIRYINIILKPVVEFKVPLEIIFKTINSTINKPLIKYNSSARQENVYRLFADKISTDGRKIPYLKKATIFKLMKSIGRKKSVSIYIDTSIDNVSHTIVCEFDEDGFIEISSEFTNVVDVNKIDEIFKEVINPIIGNVQETLEQSGYKFIKFNSLNDKTVEIKQINWETKIKITKKINLDEYIGCVSRVFINETDQFKDTADIKLRFKRVANYNKFTAQEAFILEKSSQGLRGDQIINELIENFPGELDRKGAIEMVSKIANELEVERGVRKTDIKIKSNPGFKTTISLEKNTGIITILAENINNLHYLQTVPIYVDTMVRLTQMKKSSDKTLTSFPIKEINQLCSSGEKEEEMVDDIISSVEQPLK